MNIKKLRALKNTPPWEWPGDAGEIFLGVLVDRRACLEERVLAARLAGNCCAVNDTIVDALLEVLRAADEPEELRGRAAIALGPALEEFDTYGSDETDRAPICEGTFTKAREALRAAFEDAGVPKGVRRRVLEAAVRAPDDWHAPAIRDAYASCDPDWKLTAVFCMQYVKGFDDEIVTSLDDAEEAIRYHAIVAAGTWGVEGAWPHVSALLSAEHPDKDLLLAAIEAVATVRPDEAAGILAGFSCHEDEDVVDAAMEAMAMAGYSDADDGDEDSDEDSDEDADEDADEDGEDEEEKEEDDEDDDEAHGKDGKGRKPGFPPHLLS